MGASGAKGEPCCERRDDKPSTPAKKKSSERFDSPCSPDTPQETVSEMLARLDNAASDVEQACRLKNDRGKARGSSCRSKDPELDLADDVIERVITRLRRVRKLQRRTTWHGEQDMNGLASTLGIEIAQRDQWEEVLQGRRPSFRSFKEIASQVRMENKIVKLWQDETAKGKRRQISSSELAQHIDGASKMEEPIDSWADLNVFELDMQTQRSLSRIFMSIWLERGLDRLCKVTNEQAVEYVNALESQYKDNPYHNRIHAADVTATSYYLLSRFSQKEGMGGYVRDVDILAMMLSASCHDVGHPGVNNDFLNRTGNRLALRYNDRSTLENYHVATAFELMRELNIDMLAHNLPSPPSAALRLRIIDMVLATDMSRHKTLCEEMVSELTATNGCMQHLDKITLEKNLLHSSDIGHPLRPFHLHRLWSERVNDEFLLQGDQEKLQGFEPVALFDRDKAPPLAKGQIGFINFVVLPAWKPLTEVLGDAAQEPDRCLKENIEEWAELAKTTEDSS